MNQNHTMPCSAMCSMVPCASTPSQAGILYCIYVSFVVNVKDVAENSVW